ncbi:MAG: phage shock protein operon transcriptional activator [Gammaproteobacteria bacterium]|nr:phage shock protein operon transcriptional activator [Gammaproteobacteria bacterium]
MMEHVSRAAGLRKPVLIIGERGTGKELIASRLHFLSGRWEQPFVKLNCSALTESILESELFGHEAGAFTGASKRHIGRFERADQGTLFLDELATIPQRMQEKILRVIEYGEFERVGGSETLTTDVRIVGATNADLPALARQGRFRIDLLDRLAFDVINVPPLRARREDIMPLAEHFAVNVTSELGREFFAGFTDNARETLVRHDWPGNVRGLKNAVERSVYRTESPTEPISEIVFDPFVSPFDWQPETAEPGPDEVPDSQSEFPQIPGPQLPELPINLTAHLGEIEQAIINKAMAKTRYNQRQAAKLLDLSYHQLRGRLKKYDLIKES